jgi:uncharacterized membrane protein YdbT with pleckstrin-like domain
MRKIENLIAIDPNETIKYAIRKHWIGVVAIVATTVAIEAVFMTMLVIVAANESSVSEYLSVYVVYSFFLLLIIGAVVFSATAVNTYRQNQMVITNQNFYIIHQNSIFGTNISQINLSKIQDVHINQEGVLDEIFDYGTITVETAGEAANFIFTSADKADIGGRQILEAHERYIEKFGNFGAVTQE